MAQVAYAVKDGEVIQVEEGNAWAAGIGDALPVGDVYVWRSYDDASHWRVLQRRTEHYGLPRTAAQLLPITFEQLPQVVRLAHALWDW